jgi:GT2 family glycosyltransferase
MTAAEFEKVMVLEVELAGAIPAVSGLHPESGERYRRGLALVRLHTQPLGVVEVQIGDSGLSADGYAAQIWDALRMEISAHLAQDGLPPVAGLTAAGLPVQGMPRCVEPREALRADAPLISVVVATRNRTQSLAATLRSLLAQDYPSFEIVVVDNAPDTDETAEYIERLAAEAPQVRYVREDMPGLAVAHNRGMHEVRGTYVAFTDDDVIVDRHWLAEIARGFRAMENVACVTGLIFPGELETPAQLLAEQYGGFAKGFATQIFDLGEYRLKSPLYPYAIGAVGSGANMAFRTSALREMGGFDPALGAGSRGVGGDDLAAFYQVITRGWRLVYQPAAIVHHWDPREFAALRRRAYGYGVGLTAYLTKCLVDRPWLALDIAIRVPYGLLYLLRPGSQKNKKKRADYPKELNWIERKGMLAGPLAYLRSRWHVHKLAHAAPRESSPALPGTGSTGERNVVL